MSWFCTCGLLNNGLNATCAAARTSNQGNEHNQASANTADAVMAVVALRGIMNDDDFVEKRRQESIAKREMTDNEKLFAKYYAKGKILVIDMDDTALREHREALREIATEAKAQLMAADDEIRERGAKKKLKDKEWLVSVETDRASTDAINAVAARKGRMSKLDKLRKDLEKSGLSDEVIKEMMSKLERTATEKNLKTITFNKPETVVSVVQVESKEPSKPFDPSSLFGK